MCELLRSPSLLAICVAFLKCSCSYQQCDREVDCVEAGGGDVAGKQVRRGDGRGGLRGRRGGGRGGRGRRLAGRRRIATAAAVAEVCRGEEGEGAEEEAEGGRDLEGVAHVDVARRHEEREDGEQGEGQAQGCKGGKMVKLVHCTGLTLKDVK